MATEIDQTPTNNIQFVKVRRNNGIIDSIAIDNDSFDDDHDFFLDIRDMLNFVMNIQNTGSTNGLSYEIYGSIDPQATQPTFNLINFHRLEEFCGDLTPSTNEMFILSNYFIWIFVRLRRQSATLDTTSKILTTTGVPR